MDDEITEERSTVFTHILEKVTKWISLGHEKNICQNLSRACLHRSHGGSKSILILYLFWNNEDGVRMTIKSNSDLM